MMRMAVLLGNPVAHSRSPAMFRHAFAQTGVDGVYVPWHIETKDLPAALNTLRAVNAFGANVTVPHKQSVLPLLDALTPLAKKIGAVNCIIQKNGKLTGDNTDVYGFAESLRLNAQVGALKKRKVLILGAGGAARAVIAALDSLGIRTIAVCNRQLKRRQTLQRDFPFVSVHGWSKLAALLPDAGLVVHATSAEVHHEPVELAFSALPKDAIFADLTYGHVPLVQQALKSGLDAFDGGDMLVLQAARAFQLWTRKAAPLAVMRKSLR